MIRIGPYVLGSRVVLAPMAGVTDRPFRILCRRLGAGLAASEMLTCDTRLWHTPKSRRRLDHTAEPEPRVVQLAGADPQALADAARMSVELGAQIVDLNMGCPAKKVCGKLCGSALLRDESLVERILGAVVRAVDVPVTLKIRTGWDHDHRNAVQIARVAERCGIQALAVHGRTRVDFYQGEAEYQTIRDVKCAVRIPVFANGDIRSPADARKVIDFTGADGVMIGRGSFGRPWIFRTVDSFLNARTDEPLLRAEVRDMILAHLDSLYGFYGEETGVRIARKHIGWYCEQCLPDPEPVRAALMTASSTAEQRAGVRRYFDGGDGPGVDERSDGWGHSDPQRRSRGGYWGTVCETGNGEAGNAAAKRCAAAGGGQRDSENTTGAARAARTRGLVRDLQHDSKEKERAIA